MTNEVRTLIELSDITGVEVECPKCRLRIVYPVMVKTEVTIAVHCPHCREPWFDREFARIADEQDAYPAVVDIKEITSRLRAMTVPPRTDIKANIRFHINLEQVKK